MKIVLINPPYGALHGIAPQGFSFPLGLGYIAAYLRQAGHTIRFFDLDPDRKPQELMWRKAAEFRPDIVGITSFTPNFMAARKLALEAKRRLGCLVIMGGPHVTALPLSTLQSVPALDAVILGEGEIPMLALAAEFDARGKVDFSKVPGAAFMEGGHYREIPRPEPISELDSLPYPARDLADIGLYKRGQNGATLMSSRGCPAQCTFCANICMGRKFRAHSPAYVVGEITYLVKKYGIRHFRFEDDCFTADRNRVIEICDLIINARLDITWAVSGRVNTLRDAAVIKKMKQAGCIWVQLGIETGSQRINDLMKKGTTLAMAEECCAALRRHGMPYLNAFIIGNEGDTLETVMSTIAFSRKLRSEVVLFHMMIPYPGTALFDKYYRDYDTPGTDWSNWCSLRLAQPYEYRQTALSKKVVWWLVVWAQLQVLLNPFQMFRLVSFSLNRK